MVGEAVESFEGTVEAGSERLSIYKGPSPTPHQKFEYNEVYFKGSKPVHEPADIYSKTEPYWVTFIEPFMAKIEFVKNKEKTFNDFCRAIFLRKTTRPNFIGQTHQQEGAILCFPEQPEKKILKAFVGLLSHNAISKAAHEPDNLKVQRLEIYRNMEVWYWSDYFLSTNRQATIDQKNWETKYLSMNEHGLSLNDYKILNPKTINESWNFLQMKNCWGAPLSDSVIDVIVPGFRKHLHKNCCWTYEIFWDGRYVNDAICSANKDPDICELEIRMVRATIYFPCLKERLKDAAKLLLNPKTDLTSK